MESNQLQVKSQNFSPVGRLVSSLEGKKISESSEEEIKQSLRYGIILLGIASEKFGDDLSKQVLINHLRKVFGGVTLEELKLSFEFALEKRTEVNLVLYQGEFISAKYVGEILTAFLELKKKMSRLITEKPDSMTNSDRGIALFDIIKKQNPELYEKFKNFGKEKYVKPEPREKTEAELVIQDIFIEFDELHKQKENGHKDSIRIVNYNGKEYTQEDFLRLRLEELNRL